jgi:hypothetical protein
MRNQALYIDNCNIDGAISTPSGIRDYNPGAAVAPNSIRYDSPGV